MTAIRIAQQVAAATGISIPQSLRQAGGEGQRILPLIQQTGDELSLLRDAHRAPWPELVREHRFETVAGTEWYALPSDLTQIISDTMWDRGSYRPAYGQISPQEWQLVKGGLVGSIALTYRFRRQFNPATSRMDLRLDPVPDSDGRRLAFEYCSRNWVRETASGPPLKSTIDKDLDVPVFPFNVMKLGVEYLLRRAKGLPHQSHRAEFEMQADKELGIASNPRRVQMGERSRWSGLTANVPESGYGIP